MALVLFLSILPSYSVHTVHFVQSVRAPSGRGHLKSRTLFLPLCNSLAQSLIIIAAANPPKAMSFLEKLILGLAGSEIIDDLGRQHDRRVQEREQRRLDSLFWQDAARRDRGITDEFDGDDSF